MRRVAGLLTVVLGCGRVGFGVCAGCDHDGETIEVVQTAGPGSVLGPSLAITIDQTAEDLLVIAIYRFGDNPISVGDSLGESYSSLPIERANAGCLGGDTQLWYSLLTRTGTNTITVRQDGAGAIRTIGAFLIEYSGIAATRIVDVASGQIPATASNSMTAGTLTTTGPAVIVAVFADTIPRGTMIPDPDWRMVAHDDGYLSIVEDKLVAAGTYTPTANLPAGAIDDCWTGASAAFRAR